MSGDINAYEAKRDNKENCPGLYFGTSDCVIEETELICSTCFFSRYCEKICEDDQDPDGRKGFLINVNYFEEKYPDYEAKGHLYCASSFITRCWSKYWDDSTDPDRSIKKYNKEFEKWENVYNLWPEFYP